MSSTDPTWRTDESTAVAQVKQYGGVEPNDLVSLPSVSNHSTPAARTRCGGGDRPVQGRRLPQNPRTLCAPAIGCPESLAGFKDRRLMALMPESRSSEQSCLQLLHSEGCKTISCEQLKAATTSNASPRADAVGAAASHNSLRDILPLEEQLCLEDLHRIMVSFSSLADVAQSEASPKALSVRPTEGAYAESHFGSSFMSRCSPTPVGKQSTVKTEKRVSYFPPVKGKQMRGLRRLIMRTEAGRQVTFGTKEELQQVLLGSWESGQYGDDTFSRVLSESEFSQAVRSVLPTAEDEEILDLMRRVDYEAKGGITWDDFTTFLVSQGRHHSNISQGSFGQLSNNPEPESCAPSQQHVNGTCMDADLRRNILLTGGSEGTVRAWSFDTLKACGVVFNGDCWVVGVHWANYIKSIIIVTMDRRVIVLDAETLEVRRLFRGRPVLESFEGYMYAQDSVEVVRIGGTGEQKLGRFGGNAGITGRGRASRTRSSDGKPVAKPAHGPGGVFSFTGRASCLQSHVVECTLAGLVDSVTCSLYHRTLMKEDMILLATTIGEVRFYSIPRTMSRVVPPHAVIRLHEKRINKMSIYFESNALLTASDDGYVRMTSLDNGALLRAFPACGQLPHTTVHDFDFDPELRMLVTVGPERHGVVWDFAHETAMAVLDSHNGPCRCCAMQTDRKHIVTVGADGTIFIFDSQGFRLLQVICADRLHPQRVVSDPSKKRILCLATYPYFHGRNRDVALAYTASYKGHMAPMVGVSYNTHYDLIVTIDSEGLVMTWKRSTGAPSFTFQIKEFSNSAVMNAGRLTCFTFDRLERRLLTGFHNGAAAVWNLMNGQTTNVITAAAENSHRSIAGREVTAIGTLLRDGINYFIFASGGCLYTVHESSTFTIASAAEWEIPSNYGDVVQIVSVSPHCVVCGTSYGALFFYRVLAERQEGSVLWALEHGEQPLRLSTGNAFEGRRSDQSNNIVTSRIVRIFPLQPIGEHVLLSVHADGTVALWHTLRRMMMGSVSLRSAFPVVGFETGLTHVAAHSAGKYLVFCDEQGNVHVCSMELREVPRDPSTQAPCVKLHSNEGKRTITSWPGSPFGIGASMPDGEKEKCTVEVSPDFQEGVPEGGKKTGSKKKLCTEDTLHRFSRFYREHVFHCGFSSVSGVAFLEEPMQGHTAMLSGSTINEASPHVDGKSAAVGAMEQLREGHSAGNDFDGGDSAKALDLNLNATSDMMITISSGVDNLTRVFTLDGMVVGECGMNTWIVGDPESYMLLNAKPSKKLPPRSCCTDCKDFLAEAASAERMSTVRKTRSNKMLKTSISRIDLYAGLEASTPNILHLFNNSSPFRQYGCVTLLETVPADCDKAPSACNDSAEKGRPSRNKFPENGLKGHRGSDVVDVPLNKTSNVINSSSVKRRQTRRSALKTLIKPEYIGTLRGALTGEGTEVMSPMTSTPDLREERMSSLPTEAIHDPFHVLQSRKDSSAQHALDLSISDLAPTTVADVRPTGSQFHTGVSECNSPLGASRHVIRGQPWVPPGRGCSINLSVEREMTSSLAKSYPKNNQPTNAKAVNVLVEKGCSPIDFVQGHMESRRRLLLSIGCNDPVVAGVSCSNKEAKAPGGAQRVRGNGTSPVRGQPSNLPRKQATSILATRSRIAQITSRLKVVPIEEIMPPKGTRVREQTAMWKEMVKKVGNNTS
uniref:Predicted WD40 repeat protein n=1 Tax=Trypanosoma congolense (strain IL3000) TaxID=1068625 RepID=G0UXT4_TRYCI|nr:predicted WD40 repeat protein [Trypanosoma congolense IL3000]